jgi:mannose-6-phosphate isomerase-like protein (cupin superfamily)
MDQTRRVLDTLDVTGPALIAPDGSLIRELLGADGASLALCELAAGDCSRAVRHRTVVEIWYFLEGRGEVWRRYPDGREETVAVWPGMCLRIPTGADFQFRNTGARALKFLLVTLPPWPGPDEAVAVVGRWVVADLPRTG